MTAYYNEIDPYAAEWLRNLMRAEHIAQGDIDTRSIEDVRPDDLREYKQCHFFAGIGVWDYALKLAGWPSDWPVWTGSCPCQPFSSAGKRRGFDDERHLWPVWFRLIEECRPPVVFGEQVASKDGLAWLDLVQADLEGAGYAAGAVDLCAAGVGAPHIRQRLFWVAYADGRQLAGQSILRGVERDGQNARRPEGGGSAAACRDHGGLAHADSTGLQPGKRNDQSARHRHTPAPTCDAGRLADAESERWNGRESSSWAARRDCFEDSGDIGGLADATEFGRREECSDVGRGAIGNNAEGLAAGLVAGGRDLRPGPTNGHWRDADWLFCRDGRWRPAEPGSFPLAHGASARVGRLRAYGNAIVPQVAAEVIRAFMDCNPAQPAAPDFRDGHCADGIRPAAGIHQHARRI
jgi:DNA (cytosine-5)-methyltransferase 1